MVVLAIMHAFRFETIQYGWLLTGPAALKDAKTAFSQCDFRHIPLAALTLTVPASDAFCRFSNAYC